MMPVLFLFMMICAEWGGRPDMLVFSWFVGIVWLLRAWRRIWRG